MMKEIDSLRNRLKEALEESGVGSEEALLVGFSGGRDSVALVELLLAVGFRSLTLCHVDHGLRKESVDDAAWCKRWADLRGLAFRGCRVDVGREAEVRGCGLEEAGRAVRYGFFEEVAEGTGTGRLVLAHHADDQVETFLFRLLRGAGMEGLGGMGPLSWRQGGRLGVLRPMLGIWRREIDGYLKWAGAEYREDASNADLRWTRNRIRHELLPEMERVMGRPVGDALWRAAELLRVEGAWAKEREMEAFSGSEGAKDLEVETLKSAPQALRRRMILNWLKRSGVAGVGFVEVELVLGLVKRVQPARVNLPSGWFARRRGGRIFLEGGLA